MSVLFRLGVFIPDGLSDIRAAQVLRAVSEMSGDSVAATDLFLGICRHRDANVQELLCQTLEPGVVLDEVISNVEAGRNRGATLKSSRRRDEFSRNALLVLDEFEAALERGSGCLDSVALELLTFCVLAHLEDRTIQSMCDVERSRALFLRHLEEAFGRNQRYATSHKVDSNRANKTPDRDTGAIRLPPEIAPSEDLTSLAITGMHSETFPYDTDSSFDRLFDTMTRVLHRSRGHHILLTGERGVGKNTVVCELARRASVGRIAFLKERRFLRVDCRFIPPDESRARLAAILSWAAPRCDLILCLDGFPSLLAGGHKEANRAVLMSGLSQARCQFIGLLSPRDFEELVADDAELTEFFAKVEVEEPDQELALRILEHLARSLEHKYQVTFDSHAIRQAVMLSANYILNDQLPSKALRILQRICDDISYERTQLASSRTCVTEEDVVRVVEEMSGVPAETLRGVAERTDYEQSLGKAIIGQAHAVRAMATELGLIKAGMTDPMKPASVLLFLGQTGTGKTEMAKALARFYSTSKRLKTYTLGNCVEPHSVSTIIGVPPGYVGHDQGGRLVNELNSDPYSVFLLDEADKAHPDVLQPFLNLFDEGWVSDQRGVRGYASKSIFILTTNVGQHMISEMIRQGKGMDEICRRMKEALSQIRHSKSDRPVFTPEFLARIKRIIVFNSLDHQAMSGICQKLITEMQRQWFIKRGKSLEVPEALIRLLADRAHQMNENSQGKEGGRIVHKLISEWIEARVQQAITLRSREYKDCTIVALDVTDLPTTPEEQASPEVAIQFR